MYTAPKKVYICKTAAIVPITLDFAIQNKILHILTCGKIALKKRFAHFFSVSHFPFSKCTFSDRF